MKKNPMRQRQWYTFKRNRRGYFSLWLFCILFFFSLPAEFIANDKPLLVKFQNQYYFPILVGYPETVFGGDFDTETDYRDAFIQQKINESGWMIWPIIRYRYDTINYDLTQPSPSPPTGENWLGTDDQGRDVLSRLIYGFRISVLFGLFLTIGSSIVGILFGALQGYYGGKVDLFSQRLIEIWSSLPELFILIILASLITPSFGWLLLITLLFSWGTLTSVVRAEFLRARNFEYVKAAKALGVRNRFIILRHVLPNAMVSTMTYLPFILSGSITTLTALDFLGFGLPVGSPSLGELLSQGKANLHAPWLGLTGFFCLAITLSLLVFIGEAVREAFDPRHVHESR